MTNASSSIIDEFSGKGSKKRKSKYQLGKDNNGKYYIKRDDVTLLIYPEEEKAKRGFKTLRERRAKRQATQ